MPKRGIYDNMKTAIDKVSRGKQRAVNARFKALCSHYLFEPQFCNVAFGALNEWLAKRCLTFCGRLQVIAARH
ncbi:MAG: hypothetical protein EBU75_02245 [Betaproteobacteria bacterium]|nr:hypothetical protein [Betaproteobacteria bacterium]